MRPVPIYTTSGDWAAMLIGNFLYNTHGEWIGWVDAEGLVWSVRGEYAGWLSKDFRVLRRRDRSDVYPRRQPPPTPAKVSPPTSMPLPPLMAELTYDTIDVLEEAPHYLGTLDLDQLPDID